MKHMNRQNISLDVIHKEIVETEAYLKKYRDLRSKRLNDKKSRDLEASAKRSAPLTSVHSRKSIGMSGEVTTLLWLIAVA